MDVPMTDAPDAGNLSSAASSLGPEAEALVAVAAVADSEVSAHHHTHHSLNPSVSSTPSHHVHPINASTTTSSSPTSHSQSHVEVSPPSSAQRERNSLTLNQRRALRRWANSQVTRPSHKMCQEWFEREYGQSISQSTVSHSLSPKYSRLDTETPQLSGSRLRFGNWPDVERLVLKWYQQVMANGRHPTNEELAEKAKNVFMALPQYKEEMAPEFSPGWIHRFKKRYGLLIRRQRRHGDIENAAEDLSYLTDCLYRYSAGNLSQETSPASVRELISRIVGVEPTLSICALVRDEVIRRNRNPDGISALSLAATTANSSPAQQIPDQQANLAPQFDRSSSADQAPNTTGLAVAAVAAVAAAAASVANHSNSIAAPAPTPPLPVTVSLPVSVSAVAAASEGSSLYQDDDPEIVLQKALRQFQQEEAEAEATAAAVREERERIDSLRQSVLGAMPTNGAGPMKMHIHQTQPGLLSVNEQHQQQHHQPASQVVQATPAPAPTPVSAAAPVSQQHLTQTHRLSIGETPAHVPSRFLTEDELTLTPIDSAAPLSTRDKPVRCPFCVNQRMLRTIKEAVEHLSTHVEV